MNKLVLSIAMVLSSITHVGMDAMNKRVDSPGVAWRKLNLLLQDVKNMSEREQEQALRDLPPSLKADYQELLAANASRKKDVSIAIIDMTELIDQGFIKDARDLDDVIAVVAKANNLTTREVQDIKFISTKHLEDMSKKGFKKEVAAEEFVRGEVPKKDIVKTAKDEKIVIEKKGEENPKIVDVKMGTDVGGEDKPKVEEVQDKELSEYLVLLNNDFNKELKNSSAPYEVTTQSNRKYVFNSNKEAYKDLDALVSGFFEQLAKYNGPAMFTTRNITPVQKAFINYFFPLIDTLYKKLKNSSKNIKDFENLKFIMQKGGLILNFRDIKDKSEKQNNDIVLSKYISEEVNLYERFILQYESVEKEINDLESKQSSKDK